MSNPAETDLPSLILTIPPDAAGRRLDSWLAEARPERSRTQWQALIRARRVTLEGHPVRPSHQLAGGERVAIPDLGPEAPPAFRPPELLPERPPQEWILYEDDHLVVLNKPVGMVVHPSPGHWEDSLVHRLWPAWQEDTAPEDLRPGVVHRLDKDTSGCLLWAKTREVQRQLILAVARREVHRWYLALVAGTLDPLVGRIEGPIGRDPRNRLKMAVVEGGRPAITDYFTVASWSSYSLVELKLHTGRTHQVRVHLASLGHPVVGDTFYGGPSGLGFSHQALHAWRIAFVHPIQKERMCFSAPLPESWVTAARELGEPQIGPAVGRWELEAPWPCGPKDAWQTFRSLGD
ncbi:MAG: RluA family pseudouridine synthase [Firmicutes bacterium]|nr:RluA family pseudouridine synthase [Bacillota bacterium]